MLADDAAEADAPLPPLPTTTGLGGGGAEKVAAVAAAVAAESLPVCCSLRAAKPARQPSCESFNAMHN